MINNNNIYYLVSGGIVAFISYLFYNNYSNNKLDNHKLVYTNLDYNIIYNNKWENISYNYTLHKYIIPFFIQYKKKHIQNMEINNTEIINNTLDGFYIINI